LLETCPTLTILATSREPLALRAEELRPVTPLALPDPGAHADTRALARVDAVALFCDRAAAHDPGFALDDGNAAAIAQICRRVDGLPLAIELAAARCGLLSPDELADRLDEALAAPGAGARDAAARQQTLRATIDWSHALLDEAAQAAFACFAPFAGGATIEAAEAITGADLGTLDGLVAKSLLVRRRHADEATRLRMLQTVRAYAADRLALAADGEAVRERHYRYFLALAERHGTEPALFGAGGSAHAARLDADIDNLNAALTWALSRPDAEPALALCAALGQYWWLRNRYADAANWIDRALSMPGADAHRALRVRALCSKAAALWPLGRRAELFAAITEAETIARQLADPLLLSHTLQSLARLVGADGPVGGGAAIADEALDLARAAGDDWAIGMAAFATTIAAPTLGEWRERLERAAALLDTAGNAYHLARLFAAGIGMALGYGSERDARALVERATPLVRALDDPQSWSFLLCNGGLTALLTGDTDAADDAFSQDLRLARDVVAPRFAQESLLGLAAVAAVRDDAQRAAMLTGSAAAHRDDAPQNEIEVRIDAEFLGPARARHGPDTWDAAVREGASLSLPDAIEYALHQREPVGPHTPLRG
jgi:predicted ATPase